MTDYEFQPYVHDLEFAQGSQWGEVVLWMAQGARDEGRIMRDPEAIRCAETGKAKPGIDIFLGKRQYTDDQLGVLDGPMRDNPDNYLDTYNWTKRTPKAHLTRRQRSKLRKLRRKAKRQGLPFDEAETIAVLTVQV